MHARKPSNRLARCRLPFLCAAASLVLSACSGPYLKNRMYDAADVFTVEVQSESYGLALRGGPVKFGLHYKSETGYAAGLRGGVADEHETADFAWLFFGADYFGSNPIRFDGWKPQRVLKAEEEARRKAQAGEHDAGEEDGGNDAASEEEEFDLEEFKKLPEEEQQRRLEEFRKEREELLKQREREAAESNGDAGDEGAAGAAGLFPITPEEAGAAGLQQGEAGLLEQRGKSYRALAPFGTLRPANESRSLLKDEETQFAPLYYFTQAEIILGIYGGLRLGFNAGELVDFALGIFTVDFMEDDAPYGPSLRERLEEYEFFQDLPEDQKQRIIEQIRQGQAPFPFPQ